MSTDISVKCQSRGAQNTHDPFVLLFSGSFPIIKTNLGNAHTWKTQLTLPDEGLVLFETTGRFC